MGAWVPILEGSERENARAVVLEIARALEAFLERPIESLDPAERGSLSSGYPGLALFFGHAARALERDDFRDLALAFLNETFAHWPETAPLYGGRTGVAWALAHLSWLDPRVEEPLRSLDENLGKLLEKPWPGHFDLIAGLAGISVYALERLPRAGARACLERALEHLASSALESEGALAWPTPAPLYGPVELEVCPSRRGLVNLGVAHGVPGVLAVLSLACARGVMRERLSPLVERAVSYVLGRELEGSLGFPHFVVPGRKPKQRGRSAWCYGDLGIAGALHVAGRSLGVRAWEERAVAIARAAHDRPLEEEHDVRDAALCHGALGIAHVLNRLSQASGDARLAGLARDWLARGLALRESGGVAGFRALRHRGGREVPVDDPGFLTGASGIGLALLAASTDLEPAWDRLLLLS